MMAGWTAVHGRVYIAKLDRDRTERSRESTQSAYDTRMVVEVRHASTVLSRLGLRLLIFTNPSFLGQLVYVVMSLAGNVVSPVFFALELFAFTRRVPIFNEVMFAVVKNPGRMISTILLAVIVLWIYVLIGVHFFRNEYLFGAGAPVCDSIASCFRHERAAHAHAHAYARSCFARRVRAAALSLTHHAPPVQRAGTTFCSACRGRPSPRGMSCSQTSSSSSPSPTRSSFSGCVPCAVRRRVRLVATA